MVIDSFSLLSDWVFFSKEIVLIKQVTAKLGSFHSSPKDLARNPVVSVYICGG